MPSEVYVVFWNGDEDCMGRNDGPIAFTESYAEALKIVAEQAEAEAQRREARWEDHEPIELSDWSSDGAPGVSLYGERCGVYVRPLRKGYVKETEDE